MKIVLQNNYRVLSKRTLVCATGIKSDKLAEDTSIKNRLEFSVWFRNELAQLQFTLVGWRSCTWRFCRINALFPVQRTNANHTVANSSSLEEVLLIESVDVNLFFPSSSHFSLELHLCITITHLFSMDIFFCCEIDAALLYIVMTLFRYSYLDITK